MTPIENGGKDTKYILGILILIDILVNFMTLGAYGETISSRTGKGYLYRGRPWVAYRHIIDWLFNLPVIPYPHRMDRHCQRVIRWEHGRTKEQVVKLIMEKRGLSEDEAWEIVRTREL